MFASIFSVFVGFGLVIHEMLFLTSARNGRRIALHVIRSNMARNFSRREIRVDRRYYFYILWKSQIPVGLPCGSLFIIEKTFPMAYLRELANNLVNAMLLIKPSLV